MSTKALEVTLNNTINWDFQPFRNSDRLKISQNVREFDWWITWIKQQFRTELPKDTANSDINCLMYNQPRSYLEIGSYAGESLFYMAQVLPRGSVITLVDLGDMSEARKVLLPTIEFLKQEYGHQINLITGYSHDPQVLTQVMAFAPNGRYDLVFIDANHDFQFAFQDFINYRDKGTWIAFHDISDFNIVKTVVKYGKEVANAAHIWKVIKSLIPEKSTKHHFSSGAIESITTNWVEFIDYNNDLDLTKMDLKPKGIAVLRSQW